MTRVVYEATDELPEGVPAAVVASPGRVTVLVNRSLTVDEACQALGPLINEHARDLWTPSAEIAG